MAHVQLPHTEAEFDNILVFCLGENHWCNYIEGDTTFICVIAGFNVAELTPSTPTSSANGSMPSIPLPDGGMSTVTRLFYQIMYKFAQKCLYIDYFSYFCIKYCRRAVNGVS